MRVNKKKKNIFRRRRNKRNGNNGSKGGIDRNRTLLLTYGVVLQNQMNFLPPWIECPMRYADKFNLLVLGGSFADYIYRANSCFDPDRTSIGHQPLGFDTMASVYNRYRIDKIEWYVEMSSGATSYSATVALINGAAALTTTSIAIEYPTARFKSVGFSGSPPGVWVGHKSLPKYNGKSIVAYNTDDTTGALVSANPVETIDLHIFIDPGTTTVNVPVTVSLKYRTVFYDPITPGQSFKGKKMEDIDKALFGIFKREEVKLPSELQKADFQFN